MEVRRGKAELPRFGRGPGGSFPTGCLEPGKGVGGAWPEPAGSRGT